MSRLKWQIRSSEDGPTGGRLVATLAAFWSSWARKEITQSKMEAIAKSLRPGGRSARPLRDYLSAADLTDLSKFADGMLAARQEDAVLKVQAEALRRHGLPSVRKLIGIGENMFDEYRRERVACGLQATIIRAPEPAC